MSRSFVVAALLATMLATSACGFTSSPADNLAFKAPAGWKASPGIMGFMQLWEAPNRNDEVLMLFRSPKQVSIDEIFTSANLKDTKIQSQQNITICGNQAAQLVKAEGTQSTTGRKDNNVDIVVSNTSGATYMAMYVYPAGAAPNAEATTSLRELCAK